MKTKVTGIDSDPLKRKRLQVSRKFDFADLLDFNVSKIWYRKRSERTLNSNIRTGSVRQGITKNVQLILFDWVVGFVRNGNNCTPPTFYLHPFLIIGCYYHKGYGLLLYFRTCWYGLRGSVISTRSKMSLYFWKTQKREGMLKERKMFVMQFHHIFLIEGRSYAKHANFALIYYRYDPMVDAYPLLLSICP